MHLLMKVFKVLMHTFICKHVCHFYYILFIHLYSASHSMSLSEALPTTTLIPCRS